MSSSVPADIEQPFTDTYIVDLAGLSEQERRAAVAAIEELVRPLRMSVWVENNPMEVPVLGSLPGATFDRI